jgi:dTDP-4-dehydrorhamnose 3,5-epimerase
MAIEGVIIQDLFYFEDNRGFVVEIFRSDNPFFENFGQVYMTACFKGVAKAWHYHKYQTDHFFCAWGKALVVLYDNNPKSSTYGSIQEIVLESPPSKNAIKLVKIPPLIVHGFTSLSEPEARIINIPDKLYNYKNPDEYRIAWNSPEIPYKWDSSIKFGG